MKKKTGKPFCFLFVVIITSLSTLFYILYCDGIRLSMYSIKTNEKSEGQPFTQTNCRLTKSSNKVKTNVHLNTTQTSSKCQYYHRSHQSLRANIRHSMQELNILNTTLDFLSAEVNVLLSGKVRYSDYISSPDSNLEENMVRHIGHISLQWILCIDEKKLQQFRQSNECVLQPFYNRKIGLGYTEILKEQPFPFLEALKNPCWKDSRYGLLCLPYMYLIGFPKSGTTDVYVRINKHPQFVSARAKEPHWMSRDRFGAKGIHPVPLRSFLNRHYGRVSSYISNRNQLRGKTKYTRIITGDFSASTGYNNLHWRLLPENTNRTEPLHTNADYIRHLYPGTKIVAILRNPVDRLYSGYRYFREGRPCELSPENFHNNVVASLDATYRCFRLHSIRRCTYDDRLHHGSPLRLWVGIYYVYLLDYHRTFPRNQIFVFTTANYSQNTLTVMDEMFRFLELDPMHKVVVNQIKEKRPSHVGKTIGPMMNETRKILNDFYRPFNRLLADLLNDSSFNFDLEGN